MFVFTKKKFIVSFRRSAKGENRFSKKLCLGGMRYDDKNLNLYLRYDDKNLGETSAWVGISENV